MRHLRRIDAALAAGVRVGASRPRDGHRLLAYLVLECGLPPAEAARVVPELDWNAVRAIDGVLAAPATRAADVEDVWLFLHLLFEAVWKYRFLYRDLNDLLSRNRLLEVHFKRLLEQKVRTATALCEGLAARGELRARPGEVRALATNMVVVMTYWLSYEYVRNPRHLQEGEMVARGACQVLALVAPFLADRSRALFERLAAAYVST